MNLKDWEKLSPEEQERYLRVTPYLALEEVRPQGKCPAGLIELRNSLKRQIEEESNASSQYREASAKLVHYGHGASAHYLKKIAEQELMHHYVIRQVVDIITEECGE